MARRRTPQPQPPRPPAEPPWLLLLYQLPIQPSKLRVKTWRRLQKLGALQVKGSVYVLPNSPQAREDFEWIRTEVISMKGEASVFAAGAVDNWAHDELVAGFQAARAKDFQSLRQEVLEALAAARQGRGPRRPDLRLKSAARNLRERWNELDEIDFFRAPGRDETQDAMEQLEKHLAKTFSRGQLPPQSGGLVMPENYRNRVWLTRPRPGIDRMSSAWLIQRFIDPKARFTFAEKPKAGSKSIPFDMYGVEFSHHGNACTFETLVGRFAIKDATVSRLAKIVHDLDLKDDRHQLPERVAVGKLVEGLRQMYGNDGQLLQEGIKMFEALYRSMAKE